MALREVDPIGAAIISTEKEIAASAWDQEESVLDESGDRTVEQMGEGLEGQHEPDDDDEETEGDEPEGDEESEDGKGEPEKDAKGKTDAEPKEGADKAKPEVKAEEPQGRVPAGRLREQTERATAAETERDRLKAELATIQSTSKQQIDALNAKFDQLAASLRQPPKPAEQAGTAKTETVPDFFEDPNGFIAHQNKPLTDALGQLRNDLAAQRVETSMALAHTKHGPVFEKAFEAVSKLNPQNPDDRATVQRIYGSSNQGEALVAWHKRNETLRRVGDDPDKYEKDIEARVREALTKDPEFRKQLIEGARAEASGAEDGKPRSTFRLPKSLNGAAGGNGRNADSFQYDDSDQAVADAAWR
jgi:hypothetical protein